MTRPTPARRGLLLLCTAALVATACGSDSGEPTGPGNGTGTPTATPTADPGTPTDVPPGDPGAVRLMTHDSFNVSEEVLAAFTADTGIEVEILNVADAGSLVNQAILSVGNPQADVLFGIDNTFLSRALAADVFEPYSAAGLDSVPDSLVLDDQHRVTPIDRGDVCLNYDVAWFADSGIDVPQTLEELADPDYSGLLVVQNPATSSPGLAFLLATIAEFGEDGWVQFWEQLVDNDVAVTSGWEDAYYGRFSGASGGTLGGDRPLVVSYASSPPAEVIFAEDELDGAPTGVIEASCFQQIEFAGILAGTSRRTEAEALVDFLLSAAFQEDIPLQMFVFPARTDVTLPAEFVEHTVVPANPISLDPEVIDANREAWITEWTRVVLG